MRILWASNAPHVPTGYGQQTALMLPRLRDAGHDVAVAANFGVSGAVMEWEGFTIFPTGKTSFSADVIPAHALAWFKDEPGWCICLYDAWTMKNPAFNDINTAVWCPVDHHPVPPLVKQHFTDHGSVPIAMSQWGQRELERAGLNPMYAPHGIDTNVMRPIPKAEARERLGLDPDRFIVGMVANNHGRTPSRKAFPEHFLAFSILAQEHPDAMLYCHAQTEGDDAINLEVLATANGIKPDQLLFTDQYRLRSGQVPAKMMAHLYSAFDVLLFCSMGEGFGIPAIEAQACGTPVIVSDFSAQPELVAPGAGFKVAGQPWWDDLQKAYFHLPNIEDMVNALGVAYANRAALDDLRPQIREHALQWNADTVFETHWRPILAELEGRLPSMEPIKAQAL